MAVELASRIGRALLLRNMLYFFVFDAHFCYRLSKPQGLVWPEGLGKLIKFLYLIGSRTRDLPSCSVVPQPLRYHAPSTDLIGISDTLYKCKSVCHRCTHLSRNRWTLLPPLHNSCISIPKQEVPRNPRNYHFSIVLLNTCMRMAA
jgi:hypothetical protein